MVEIRLFNTSEVCYYRPAHENFIAAVSKHQAKWEKTLNDKEGKFPSGLVFKHLVKTNVYLIAVDHLNSYDEGSERA